MAGPAFQPAIGQQTQALTPWQRSSEQISWRCSTPFKGCTSSRGKAQVLLSISPVWRLQTWKVNGHLTQCHLHCPGCVLMPLKTWHSHLYYRSTALSVCACMCVGGICTCRAYRSNCLSNRSYKPWSRLQASWGCSITGFFNDFSIIDSLLQAPYIRPWQIVCVEHIKALSALFVSFASTYCTKSGQHFMWWCNLKVAIAILPPRFDISDVQYRAHIIGRYFEVAI